jgi:hypothetical protein
LQNSPTIISNNGAFSFPPEYQKAILLLLSPGGIRSLSKIHETPYNYQPGESTSSLFGGNSNWRGPIWMPMNYLLVLSFKKYCDYYRGQRKVDFPADSDNIISLSMVSTQLAERLISIFKKDENGKRLVHDTISQYQNDSHFKELILFYEYSHTITP